MANAAEGRLGGRGRGSRGSTWPAACARAGHKVWLPLVIKTKFKDTRDTAMSCGGGRGAGERTFDCEWKFMTEQRVKTKLNAINYAKADEE